MKTLRFADFVRRATLVSLFAAAFLFGTGAAPALGADRPPMAVLIEEGDASTMDARQYQYRVELRKYMEQTLPKKLARHGIDGRIIQARSESGTGPLLVIRYDRYNPGKTAARMIIGWGAGAASLDITATLQQGGKTLLSWTDGCGTSEHWSRLVNKLNDNMVLKLKGYYGLP